MVTDSEYGFVQDNSHQNRTLGILKYKKRKAPKTLKEPIFKAPMLLPCVSSCSWLLHSCVRVFHPVGFLSSPSIFLWEPLRNFLHHMGLAPGFGHAKWRLSNVTIRCQGWCFLYQPEGKWYIWFHFFFHTSHTNLKHYLKCYPHGLNWFLSINLPS